MHAGPLEALQTMHPKSPNKKMTLALDNLLDYFRGWSQPIFHFLEVAKRGVRTLASGKQLKDYENVQHEDKSAQVHGAAFGRRGINHDPGGSFSGGKKTQQTG